jgi:hypothetical protein
MYWYAVLRLAGTEADRNSKVEDIFFCVDSYVQHVVKILNESSSPQLPDVPWPSQIAMHRKMDENGPGGDAGRK